MKKIFPQILIGILVVATALLGYLLWSAKNEVTSLNNKVFDSQKEITKGNSNSQISENQNSNQGDNLNSGNKITSDTPEVINNNLPANNSVDSSLEIEKCKAFAKDYADKDGEIYRLDQTQSVLDFCTKLYSNSGGVPASCITDNSRNIQADEDKVIKEKYDSYYFQCLNLGMFKQ